MSDQGWCPFARQHRGAGAEGPFGYPDGARNQNRAIVFVDHRMDGYKRTLDDDAWRHANGVSVHAGVGRDGSLDQYVSIFDAAWGNGVAGSISGYDRANPLLAAIEGMGDWIAVDYAGGRAYALVSAGVNVINTHSISTEHEDEATDQPWTPAMIATSIAWKRWCIEEYARAGWKLDASVDALTGHFQIDAVNRASCPGSHWPKADILAGLSEGEPMTPQELERLANLERQALSAREDLNALANGVDALTDPSKALVGKLSLKGLWYVAQKAWPF